MLFYPLALNCEIKYSSDPADKILLNSGEKYSCTVNRGVAKIFQRGGHTLSNIIVMAFSPRYIVGCLLKKRLTKGGSRAPQDPPSYALGEESAL